MSCQNQKCKNIIYLETNCKICGLAFCCKNCLYHHEFDSHKKQETSLSMSKKNLPDGKKLSYSKSFFTSNLLNGVYSTFYKFNSKYDLKNFEIVSIRNNQNSKALIKAKNTVDNKYYFIDEVIKTYIYIIFELFRNTSLNLIQNKSKIKSISTKDFTISMSFNFTHHLKMIIHFI